MSFSYKHNVRCICLATEKNPACQFYGTVRRAASGLFPRSINMMRDVFFLPPAAASRPIMSHPLSYYCLVPPHITLLILSHPVPSDHFHPYIIYPISRPISSHPALSHHDAPWYIMPVIPYPIPYPVPYSTPSLTLSFFHPVSTFHPMPSSWNAFWRPPPSLYPSRKRNQRQPAVALPVMAVVMGLMDTRRP